MPIKHKFKAENEAASERIAELEKALGEIHRRTGLLLCQNAGRWSRAIEHDRRTMDVLLVNQEIAAEVLCPDLTETAE